MLKNNFLEIITDKGLKITKVANDTGISRTTLTALAYNSGKGVQFDTLNKLCGYFNIHPATFFSYIPIDFEFNIMDFLIDDFLDGINGFPLSALMYMNIHDNKGNRIDSIELEITGHQIIASDGIHYSLNFNYTREDIEKILKIHPPIDVTWFKVIKSDMLAIIYKQISSQDADFELLERFISSNLDNFFDDISFEKNFKNAGLPW